MHKKMIVTPIRFHQIQVVASALIIAAVAWYVYHPLLTLAFWGDDTFLMKLAAKHNAFELLFKGPARAISQNNFMPFLGLTFYIDHLLFGFGFLGRNLHSLFWLMMVGYLAHIFMRQLGLNRWTSLSGGIILMATPAAVSVAGHYSNRHYLFGLAFALLSLIMVVKWCRAGYLGCFWAALFFYFLALSSKEIYAPLPVIAGFLSWRLGGDTKKTVIGFLSLFGLYIVLRWIMLGTMVGGYAHSIEWSAMVQYLFKSLPRLVQTLVWGGAAPGQTIWPAVALGSLVILATVILAGKKEGPKGVVWFGVLLILSLCVVALTLYVPQIRYAEDPFYCHGDRLALAFSTVTWLSFWYFVGRWLTEKKHYPKYLLVLALTVIVPLIIFGGRAKAHHWKKEKATIAQASYINDHATQNWLVIGHPTWFLRHYMAMLNARNPEAQMRSVDQPDLLKTIQTRAFALGIALQPDQPIIQSSEKDELGKWLAAYIVAYCRLLPDRCPQDSDTLIDTFSETVSSRCEPILARDQSK